MSESKLTNWSRQDKADHPKAYHSALVEGVSKLMSRYRTLPGKFVVVRGQPLFLRPGNWSRQDKAAKLTTRTQETR